jgi:glycosyltransferase involved in cell wall biosynthesis
MVGVAHPGTQHSWETALAFQENGRLGWYATSSYFQPSRYPDRAVNILPPQLRHHASRELLRRRDNRLDDEKIRRHMSTEALERILRLSGSAQWADILCDRRHDGFAKKLIALIRREPVGTLWTTQNCAAALDWARSQGIRPVLDQATVHYASADGITRAEYERHPEFFSNGAGGIPTKVLEQQAQAILAADLVVVGSSFAAKTLEDSGVPRERIRIVPYGYSDQHFSGPRPTRRPFKGRPVEFLFVGSLKATKGLAYLLKAFRLIDPRRARLSLVGPLNIPRDTFAAYTEHINYLGQVPRWEVAAHMFAADCFVFPSLFEGGGIVLYEAAAAGLGIIQSSQCGDGVRRGRNGVILQSVSVDTIVESIEHVLARPEIVEEWGAQSWAMREERSWSAYRRATAQLLEERDSV